MMPHDPKDEDDEADDCTLPVDPLPSRFTLIWARLGEDYDGEAEDEDKDDKRQQACVGCVGLLILIIWAIYQALSIRFIDAR